MSRLRAEGFLDSPVIPVEEYLNTYYDPDVEFVDGVLVERNVGDWLHSLTQRNVLFALRRKCPHLKVVLELRVERHQHALTSGRRVCFASCAEDQLSY